MRRCPRRRCAVEQANIILSRSGALDYAELYFEYFAASQISIDESIIEGAIEGVSLGVGVRVVSGGRTGYDDTGGLTSGKIREAARVAARIADAASVPRWSTGPATPPRLPGSSAPGGGRSGRLPELPEPLGMERMGNDTTIPSPYTDQ